MIGSHQQQRSWQMKSVFAAVLMGFALSSPAMAQDVPERGKCVVLSEESASYDLYQQAEWAQAKALAEALIGRQVTEAQTAAAMAQYAQRKADYLSIFQDAETNQLLGRVTVENAADCPAG